MTKNLLSLKPISITPSLLSLLEKRNLIKRLLPSKKLIRNKRRRGVVETVYSSSRKYGTHKLICVKLRNSSRIRLNSHPDNEEFIIVNNTNYKFKPLYLAVGRHKHDILQNKIKNNKLNKKDIVILRLKYNDPKTCIFTMLKNTPHCEITSAENKMPPIFFVTEPTCLKTRRIKLHKYKITADIGRELR